MTQPTDADLIAGLRQDAEYWRLRGDKDEATRFTAAADRLAALTAAGNPADQHKVQKCPKCGSNAACWDSRSRVYLCHVVGCNWWSKESPVSLSPATPPPVPAEVIAADIWTDDECFRLNAAQHDDRFHGYTCGKDSRHRPLIATRQGWRCADCDYRQGWAHGVARHVLGGEG